MRLFISLLAAVASGLYVTPESALAQASGSPFTTGHRFDSVGREVGTISPDPDGSGALPFPASRNTFDVAGRLIMVETGSLATWQADSIAPANWSGFTVYRSLKITYDWQNRKLTEATLAAGGSTLSLTQYSYDANGRLQCTAVRMNPAVYGSLPADACTLSTTGSAGSDRITKNVYDAAGQLIQVRKAVGTALEEAYATYAYSQNGKQTDVVDANGNHAQFVYDGFDRQSQWIFPSPAKAGAYNPATQASALASANTPNTADYEAYAYDANSNRTSLKKRDGSVLTYNYDALNRITSKVVPQRSGLPSTDARSVFYSYDLQGHQLTARFDSATGEGVTNSFDALGRQLTATLALDSVTRTVSYQYDADGNRTRVTFPDGNYATYAYDGLDRPSLIQRSGTATIASYGYNPDGTRASFNGGVNTGYGYDGIGRLSSLSNNPAGNAAFNNSYGFSYNPASQITTLTKSNNAFVFAGTYNVNRGYTVNGLNQYTAAGTASFTYDANANLTGDGSNTFLYDIENRLVGAGGVRNAQLRYDPLGRLYEVVGPSGTTRFFYGGDELLAEYDASGNLLRRYVHGADLKSDDPIAWYEGAGFAGGNERFLRPDWQGSIGLVTDNAGATVYAANTYDEYGIPGSGNAGRFQYTGQAWITDLGMYYYKARMYSPTLGRFMQTDPIGYKDQINLYEYVGDDPMDNTDPTGNCTGSLIVGVDCSGLGNSLTCIGDCGVQPPATDKANHAAPPKSSGPVGTASKFIHAAERDAKDHPVETAIEAAIALGINPEDGEVGAAPTYVAEKLAIDGLKQASEKGFTQLVKGGGKVIAGPGAKRALGDAPRLVAEYGGKIGDWVQVTSTTVGEKLQIHAFKNTVTGEIFEAKSVLRAILKDIFP